MQMLPAHDSDPRPAIVTIGVLGLVAWVLVGALATGPEPVANPATVLAGLDARPDEERSASQPPRLGSGPGGTVLVRITERGYEVRHQPPAAPLLLGIGDGSSEAPPSRPPPRPKDLQVWTLPLVAADVACDAVATVRPVPAVVDEGACRGEKESFRIYDDVGLRRVLSEFRAAHPEIHTVIIEGHAAVTALAVTRVMDIALAVDPRTGRPLMAHVLLSPGVP